MVELVASVTSERQCLSQSRRQSHHGGLGGCRLRTTLCCWKPLNDVFGIQSRGGWQCAGPYSQRLLGLTGTERNPNGTTQECPSPTNQQIEHALVHSKERAELLRPVYSRLSLPFKGLDKEQEDYV